MKSKLIVVYLEITKSVIQNKNRALHTDTNTHKGSYATYKLLHTVVGSLQKPQTFSWLLLNNSHNLPNVCKGSSLPSLPSPSPTFCPFSLLSYPIVTFHIYPSSVLTLSKHLLELDLFELEEAITCIIVRAAIQDIQYYRLRHQNLLALNLEDYRDKFIPRL